jgi:Peptidase A4 family
MPQMVIDSSLMLVPTKLSGVFTKVRRPDVAADTSNISSLFNSNLLSRLLKIDTPGARTFREKVLSRRWLPEDQISPVLAPQIGVTHLLTPSIKVADASFTTNNWSGGTIQGTWSAVLGMWRIPTVTRPSTPQGTGGGWNSSSWAGIDAVRHLRPRLGTEIGP